MKHRDPFHLFCILRIQGFEDLDRIGGFKKRRKTWMHWGFLSRAPRVEKLPRISYWWSFSSSIRWKNWGDDPFLSFRPIFFECSSFRHQGSFGSDYVISIIKDIQLVSIWKTELPWMLFHVSFSLQYFFSLCSLSHTKPVHRELRGECLDPECDCTSYKPLTIKGGPCYTCGHYPAKHSRKVFVLFS